MTTSGKIKVLIVDDSPVFRQIISNALKQEASIKVIGVAGNVSEARHRIMMEKPDVITCDIEMPLMDGIEFVRWLMPQVFIPVVMVSSVSSKVFDAMEAGAVDFVVKPNQLPKGSGDSFAIELIRKIKTASVATATINTNKELVRPSPPVQSISNTLEGIVAIGASTGGTEAIFNILRNLPPTMPGMVVVQHIPSVFSKMFAERLNNQTAFQVKEAVTGDKVEQGTVIVAPGDKHMKIKRLAGKYQVECFVGKKVSGHCPSVDILFDSVASVAGEKAVGVILTGMGYDGAKGLLNIKRKGGKTIGQDKETSVVYGMPSAAYNIGAVNVQAPLSEIPKMLMNHFR